MLPPPDAPTPIHFLYAGAAGEHYVMSECFRHGREAFKLPIDRGFDLVVTRAYAHLKQSEHAGGAMDAGVVDDQPVYLQVKSLRIDPRPAGGSTRPESRGYFRIKNSDLDLLCATRNSALACVLLMESDTSDYLIGRTSIAWWLPSLYLRDLRARGHFIAEPGACSKLFFLFKDQSPVPTTARENAYVSLGRQSCVRDAAPGELASGDLVERKYFDFSRL